MVYLADSVGTALFTPRDQPGIQFGRPYRAAFQKCKVQLWKAPGYTTENQGLRESLMCLSETGTVVVHKALRAMSIPSLCGYVCGDGNAQVHAFFPDRVIVIHALERERIDPHGIGCKGRSVLL